VANLNNIISSLNFKNLDFTNIEWPKFDLSGLKWSRMPEMRIGNRIVKLPIVQGGMGVGISLSGLASAVANEGGIGVIAANSIGMLDPDYYAKNRDANAIALRKELRRAREKTAGIIGVNIMVAVNDFNALLTVAMEEKADIVFLGAGLPVKGIPVEDLRASGTMVVPIVSSARAAGIIFKSWAKKHNDIPDAVVVEGPKAGGHLGFKKDQIENPDFSLETILPEVVAEIKSYEIMFKRSIPVIAAGGVYTGKDIHNLFKLGASGVQMGTRFVATHECDADIKFKEAYVSCREDDIVIINSPVGLPGRAIKSSFFEDVAAGKEKLKCAWKCLKSCDIKTSRYCISLALDNARKGILEKGFAFAGSNAYRIDKILSVKDLLHELQKGYLSAAEGSTSILKAEYERALEKLISLKEEYSAALKTGYSQLKDEYEKGIERGAVTLRNDYALTLEKISALKLDYFKMADKADTLKSELIELFERYSLTNRPSPEMF
jgi:NAD(P)H-dependent flavin oxidoreductase YrpB (nitropropane dioxygenase family)